MFFFQPQPQPGLFLLDSPEIGTDTDLFFSKQPQPGLFRLDITEIGTYTEPKQTTAYIDTRACQRGVSRAILQVTTTTIIETWM